MKPTRYSRLVLLIGFGVIALALALYGAGPAGLAVLALVCGVESALIASAAHQRATRIK